MTSPRKLLFTSLLMVALVLPTTAAAQCNPGPLGLHYLDLKTGFRANGTGGATTLIGGDLPLSAHSSCTGAGWREGLLKITIPAGCTQANIWVEYEGTPIAWSLHVADSPDNNGFGGDSGGPESEAELQVLEETLSVYSSAVPDPNNPGGVTVDLLEQEHLALTDGALKIVVSNQRLSWGQPSSVLNTSSSQLLFKLPDAGSTEPNTFYLGVNRVVSGPGSRTGCGARRVLVSFL